MTMTPTNNKRPIALRGREFVGTVLKAKAQKTATVEWERKYFVPKYERYETRRSRVQVHNPTEINATHGDRVRIMECRPLSKTKKFVIVEKLGVNTDLLKKEQHMDVVERPKKKTEEGEEQ